MALGRQEQILVPALADPALLIVDSRAAQDLLHLYCRRRVGRLLAVQPILEDNLHRLRLPRLVRLVDRHSMRSCRISFKVCLVRRIEQVRVLLHRRKHLRRRRMGLERAKKLVNDTLLYLLL